MTIVDVHCHTFNADDLPVRGFVSRVAGHRIALARVLAKALDRIVQGIAQDAAEEIAVLNGLLASPRVEGLDVSNLTAIVEQEADELFAEIAAEDPATIAAAEAEIQDEHAAEEWIGVVDFTEFFGLKRYLRWAAMFGKPRLSLTRALIQTYSQVELFTPMLVDLLGLEDSPQSTIDQQLEINEMISRLSMRGDLRAAVHPFVGFDPRRNNAVAIAQDAVEHYGCVGIKLYPPMGFLPMGNLNQPQTGMSPEEARAVDDALNDLYDWCQDCDVPITAHSNPSNQADPNFVDFSSPANWQRVLARWPNLHLNFGHFGWGGMANGWPRSICRLASQYPHVYADIGNHNLEHLEDTFAVLASLFDDTSPDTHAMKQRFMFGTDWYMVAGHKNYEQFLEQLQTKYSATFPEGLERFMGTAALSFLGFDDPKNQNNHRVRARHERHGFAMPTWIAM